MSLHPTFGMTSNSANVNVSLLMEGMLILGGAS